jgi:hypothetical protein
MFYLLWQTRYITVPSQAIKRLLMHQYDIETVVHCTEK